MSVVPYVVSVLVKCRVRWVVSFIFTVIKYLLIVLFGLDDNSYLYTIRYSVRFANATVPKWRFCLLFFTEILSGYIQFQFLFYHIKSLQFAAA